MITIKKMKLGLLLSCVAIVLSGCFGKKKSAKNIDYSGTSLKKKKGTKRWDPNLEAYVFDGEDDNDMLALADKSSSQFQKVYFDFDDRGIRADQRPAVEYDAQIAKAKAVEGAEVVILGKSDTHCISEVYNTAVSQGRADAVANELKLAGIDKSQIKAVGLGDSALEVPVRGKEPLNRCAVIDVAKTA